VRLADFLATNVEPILAEWVAFAAASGPAGAAMDRAALRDHAGAMLAVIAADLRTPQTDAEQADKAHGHAAPRPDRADTAVEVHGAGRAERGFTLGAMVAEYRALRASVIRLWTAANGSLTGADLDDLLRFNEAIDQALAESITRYTHDLEQSKDMFLAILGHDLRTPLGASLMASRFMLDTGELAEPHATLTARIASSSTRMLQLIGDLLDFTRSQLGGGIPIVRADLNVGKVVHDVVDEVAAAHPHRTLTVDARGARDASWDAARITQALANLLGNAVEHGTPGTPVAVQIRGDADAVTIAIHNRGPTIPAALLAGIFSPMKGRAARANAAATGPLGNLGLGLYIADRIVHAHRGRIAVTSSAEAGTTFTVHLPRRG